MPEIQITTEKKQFVPGVCMLIGSSKRFWRVLKYDKAANTALVIADRPIPGLPLNSDLRLITWHDCTLRDWLNNNFLNTEFTESEAEAIIPSNVSTANNPRYGTKGGEDCVDKIFIPDIDEAESLFSSDEDRASPYTWWLRSPGRGNRFFACVDHYGTVRTIGNSIDSIAYSVRPAMRINLGSEVFSKSLTRDADGAVIEVDEPQLLIEGDKLTVSRMDLEDVIIPTDVKEICENCFNSCLKLRTVRFEGSVEKIDESAFKNCRNISEVDIHPETFERLPFRVKDCLINKETIGSYLDGLTEMGKNTKLAVISMLNTPGYTERFILDLISKDNSVALGRLLDALNEPLSADDIERYSELADSTAEVKLLFMDYRNNCRKNATSNDNEFELEW